MRAPTADRARRRLRLVAAVDVLTLDSRVWDAPGVYLLVGADDEHGGLRVNVGQGPTGVRQRLAVQRRAKDWWQRAVAVVSGADTAPGQWGPADVTWPSSRRCSRRA